MRRDTRNEQSDNDQRTAPKNGTAQGSMMWQSELERLREQAKLLESGLRDAAEWLHNEGRVPSEKLIADLIAFGEQFSQVSNPVAAALTDYRDTDSPRVLPRSLATLGEAIGEVHRFQTERESRRRNLLCALKPLDDVFRLATRSAAIFPPLEACKDTASALKERLLAERQPENCDEFRQVQDGTHPLCVLVRFVRQWHSMELSNEEAEACRQCVASNYGQLLAMAIMRDHITLTAPVENVSSAAVYKPRPPEPAASPSSQVRAESETVAQSTADENAAMSGAQPTISEPISTGESNSECTGPAPVASEAGHEEAEAERQSDRVVTSRRQPVVVPPVSATPAEEPKVSADSIEEPAELIPEKGEATETSAPAEAMGFPSNCSLSEIACAIRSGCTEAWSACIWALIRDGRLDLAYHIAACRDAVQSGENCLPASAIRAMILAGLVRGDYSSLEEDYQRSLAAAYRALEASTGESCDKVAGQCILTAMTLTPALLARSSGADSVLDSMSFDAPLLCLRGLRQAVFQFARLNINLNPNLLLGVQAHTEWRSRVTAHCRCCATWLQEANRRSIIYAPTTAVWKHWLREDQPLGHVLNLVINDQRQCQGEVEEAISRWRDKDNLTRQMRRTDRELRGRKADRQPIEARAIASLRKHVLECLDLAARWKSLLESEPQRLTDYQGKQAAKCRVAVTRELIEARQEISKTLKDPGLGLSTHAGFCALRDSLDHLHRLFNAGVDPAEGPTSLRRLLEREILRVPGVELTEDAELVRPDDATAVHLLKVAEAGGDIDWWQVFMQQCAAGHFANAQRVMSMRGTICPDKFDAAQSEFDRQISEARNRIRLRLDDTESKVHRANIDGLLTEQKYHELSDRLRLSVETCTVFGPIESDIEEVCSSIEQAREARMRVLRERLEALSASDPARLRIERVIENEDILTANEYLTSVEQGRPLPPEVVSGDNVEFFPDFLIQWQKHGRKMPLLWEMVKGLRAGRAFEPLSLEAVPQQTRHEAIELIDAWRRAMGSQGNSETLYKMVREVLSKLGFRVQNLGKPTQVADAMVLDLKSDPITSRDVCRLAHFGSEAKGQYRILCLWNSPLEHTILDVAGKLPRGAPVIVFYFAPMDENRRRALAHECRYQNRSILLLDTYLLLYSARSRNHLAGFLLSASWFTAAKPYTTTGVVSPEMFYGRRQQIERIIDPRGTNLVFGGRQLGKTVLLREIERKEHRPDEGVVVRWIDLTHRESIGTTRAITDIWTVLASHLAQCGIGSRNISSPDRLEQAVQAWLGQDPNRRILLLLDEADAFLSADRAQSQPPWAQLTRLKAIMDQSLGRFKVVFAGLHNVQRTARDPNTPLAHLGEPTCIGAFLGDEVTEAYHMVVKPFRALGYLFDSVDLPTRILAYTNYYPSLIQILCRSLLESLQKEPFDGATTPPYRIKLPHIEKAYLASKDQIRNRFDWSLDLDERYRVLALVIALEIVQNDSPSTSGLDVTLIRREAMSYWAAGFRDDPSIEAFRALLDEMIGLGILRLVTADHYTLRSPNVINLLGTKEQIERQLEEAAGREPPPPYEASSFRRKLDEAQPWTRSPFTALQETQILSRDNGVTVVFGCDAAGLADVPRALSQLPQVQMSDIPDSVVDRREFEAQLVDVVRKRKAGLTIIVVPASCPWCPVWVADAVANATKPRASTTKIFRVLFVGGPEHAWTWVSEEESVALRSVNPLTLHPWHEHAMKRWLDDLQIGREQVKLDLLRSATGGWSKFLHQIGQEIGDEPTCWRKVFEDHRDTKLAADVLRQMFGLGSTQLKVLRTFAEYTYKDDALDSDPLGEDDLTALVEQEADRVPSVLRWAEALGYLRLSAADRWVLNSLLTRLLRAL